MSRNKENFAIFSAQAKALLDPLPTIDLMPGSTVARTRGVIGVQERLQIKPYILPTLSDLLIVAKYAQIPCRRFIPTCDLLTMGHSNGLRKATLPCDNLAPTPEASNLRLPTCRDGAHRRMAASQKLQCSGC